ncbi:PREDICTED: fibrinogen C domain-containing protein 1 [Bison bison bison]|uniref:Fibrinogen C domain-containing protein 1 n=1 Tax=Bison bison bison TaxID=43346 RepID=A0A6P3ILT8_BISBB|nr:PREDICTED: fibrinogen C domain-containing protein 1 [Bison bison bison]
MVNDRWKTMGGASQLEDRPRDKPQVPAGLGRGDTGIPRGGRGGGGSSRRAGDPGWSLGRTSPFIISKGTHAPKEGTGLDAGSGGTPEWESTSRSPLLDLGGLHRPSCSCVLCTVLLSLAVLLAVAVTARLLARASELQAECSGLRKGHGALGQGLSALQSEQGRLIQLLSESQGHMAHLVNSVSDVLDALQRDRGLARPHVKADLQRAPARGSRPRGCANGSRPRDCLDVLLSGQQEDGVYSVFPTHDPAGFQVYCDMRTDGGGWTVFQRREDGSVNFFRGWEAYRDGFGKLTGEHWLGLKRIHALTTQAAYELHVDLEDFDNGTAYAHYGSFGVGLFSVDPEEDGYPLTVADYSGTAGDSLLKHSGMKFTTKDRDSDHSENNCAAFYRGAWWYRNCHTSNLNGQYLRGAHASYADGVEWSSAWEAPSPLGCSAHPPAFRGQLKSGPTPSSYLWEAQDLCWASCLTVHTRDKPSPGRVPVGPVCTGHVGPLLTQESQPPLLLAAGTPSQGAEAMWNPASSSWGPLFPLQLQTRASFCCQPRSASHCLESAKRFLICHQTRSW